MYCLIKKKYLLLMVMLAAAATASASELTVVSYEPSETSLTLSSPDTGMTLTKVLGGTGGAPAATQGSYVLKATWTGQPDHKVEIRHSGLSYNLAGFDKALVDVFIPTGAALFEADGLIGIWSDNWVPDNWSRGDIVPTENNRWFTIEMDISSFNPGPLDHISALVFEHYGADNGTLYVDNIRLFSIEPDEPNGLIATGHDSRIDLRWNPVTGVGGYNIYRADSAAGPFTKINTSLDDVAVYSDFLGTNGSTKYYYVVSVVGGIESSPSDVVSAATYAMTDEQLLTSVEEATFRFFWDFGHPTSGLAREGYNLGHSDNTCAIGGSGMGLMAICVGAERGFVARADAAQRVLKILTFLDEKTPRYHGAWSHWVNGATGATIPFGTQDNGGDIVETSYLAQGMLTVRQYFDSNDTVETQIRSKATVLWEGIDWYWYLRRSESGYENNEALYWHWSPTYGWVINMPIHGYNECMITYLLAIASPTHPIPASCYYNGWASGGYKNGSRYYGYTQWVSAYETPMFFTHYTHLGFDPRDKNDNYCNYFENSRNIALIDRAYCIDNPGNFTGYSSLVWGLTASWNPWGYGAQAPGGPDNGTISPTAALSSTPYTPTESIATLKHFYHTYGSSVWGPFGFVDAFNLGESWFAPGYCAIDQGPIIVMIENYRTQLCWNLFMANPEIAPMLESIGWATRADNGLNYEYYEGTWNLLPDFDSLTPTATGTAHNFDIGLRQQDNNFAFRFTGYIEVPADGNYTFYTNSDDGSKLYINNSLVVDNDGLHTMQERSGIVSLAAGKHLIVVTYFEKIDSQDLIVSFAGPGISKKQVPVNKLFRCNMAGDYSEDCHVDINDLMILAANWLSSYTFVDFSQMAADWQK
ncbi:MAG: PA14 domain-containing protein [Phycisphaerae bacterium]|nr:PA14 domain-containing protein [Phycisphaerae bacterium]